MAGKKLLVSVFGCTLSAVSTVALASASLNPALVTIPTLQPGFQFNFTALWLKPGASNLNYVIYNQELPIQSPSWSEQELKPNFDFGFEIGLRYLFTTANDLKLTWTHLNSSTSASIQAPNSSYFLGPDYQIGPDSLTVRAASGNVNFKYDVVNLDAGQFVDFGRNVEMRFFGGLSNVYLKEDASATYTGNLLIGPFAGPYSSSRDVLARFSGIGPRVGFDGGYRLDYGISLFGEAAISALAGDLKSKTNLTGTARELAILYGQAVNNQFVKDQNVTQVIPAFDMKLGATYQYTFTNCMIFSLKAGYQAAVYVNAINQYLPGTLVSGEPFSTGGIFVATMDHTQSNFSVQGPFLEAALQI